ncbi:MAG: DDE-type integrase/transposase/recombinase [Acholeplasmataceae bacterium]|nr:DDE-type integrase/transposase/recombinase [Acholeplasmataceae bacterium]
MLNHRVSDELEEKLTTPEILDHISLITTHLETLNDLLTPLIKPLKQQTTPKHKPSMTGYASFKIDEPPIVKENYYKQLSFEDILAQSEEIIKPIKRQKPFSYEGLCLNCGAPNEYIYAHTKTQNMCKVCKQTFTLKKTYHEEITHHCPHCDRKLEVQHIRKDYDVLMCHNYQCPFYLKNKKSLNSNEADHLLINDFQHKLRYHFRLFNFTLASLKEKNHLSIQSKVDLDKIHHSKYTLGLVLTYYVNYGLSSRKTAQILKEVHDLKLTHQTVVNYAEAVAAITESLNVIYPYKLSNTITFDETYIKVMGKSNYVFFGSDTQNKIITSYRIFDQRTTKNAVTTLYETFTKYRQLPKELNVVTDGNPIYNASQVFFKMNDIHFDLYQVIGVKNKDSVSKKWRSYKQAEERLNRTYKFNYHGTNGYGSLRNANVYMSLFVTFYNFLRRHSSLNYKRPIELDILSKDDLMPNQWLKIIDYTNSLFEKAKYQS